MNKLLSTQKKNLLQDILEGKKLALEDIITLFSFTDIVTLGMVADKIRKKKTETPDIVTYIVDRNINYTNICTSKCSFCAFFREKSDNDAYLLPYSTIKKKIEETIETGGKQILLQGGLHPDLTIDYYEDLLRKIHTDFDIHIHALSPPEIVHIANNSTLLVPVVLKRLIKAGLDSIPGGGAEILDNSVRNEISPGKCNADEWLSVMETAHLLGLKTSATMMFGHRETHEQIARHLIKIRSLQEKTRGFTAFIPWPFQPTNTPLGGTAATAFDYLKVLSISRIVLDNIANIQASWVTQGSKIAQLSLRFGANDMGSTMLEENVVKAAGVSFRMNEREIRHLIKKIGFTPRRRNMFYKKAEPLLDLHI